jgi:molybdenum cofactor synthesis domain-containing protein
VSDRRPASSPSGRDDASARAEPRTAAALIIGNEILTGKIADKNLGVLAKTLRQIGVRLERAVTVLDDVEGIAGDVRALASRYTHVFTSGGVGPTHDDLTIDAVARAFDREVVVSPELEALIRKAYGERLREGHLWMARVPAGARLVSTAEVPWPTVVVENVWVLPGVPEIFALKMRQVAEVVGVGVPFVTLAVYSTLDEGHLKPFLDEVVERFPDVDVGSYPRWTDPVVRTKLTFDGRDPVRCGEARDAFLARLPDGATAEPPTDAP